MPEVLVLIFSAGMVLLIVLQLIALLRMPKVEMSAELRLRAGFDNRLMRATPVR